MISCRCSIWIHRLLRTVVEILNLKDTGVTTMTFRVTWRHLTRDHCTRNIGFHTGGQFAPTVYLARFLRYQVSKVLGSRLWPFGSGDVISHVTTGFPRCSFLLVVNMILIFKDIGFTTLTFSGYVTSSVTWPLDSQYGVSYRWSIWTDRLSRTVVEILSFKGIGVTTFTFRVTWRHRSCDRWIPKVGFPIGSKYELTLYLAWFWYIELQRSWGHELDLLGSRGVISHVTIWLLICSFLCPLKPHRSWGIIYVSNI